MYFIHVFSSNNSVIENGFVCFFLTLEEFNEFSLLQKQARRIYEILRLKETNVHNKNDYSSYRLDIKRRLNTPFHVSTLHLL